MMNKLKVGILGCADIAKRSTIPAIKKIVELELVAVASRTKEKATEFAKLFACEGVVGYENLLHRSDIDLLYIPLPTGLHEEWVCKALNAGKHVFVEKSLAIDFNSAKRMVDLAKEKNLLIMENFMFLYHNQHQFVQQLIIDGEIGEVRSFRSSFGFPPLTKDNFRYNKSLGGGALLDAASYTLRVSQLYLSKGIKVKAATLNQLDDEVDIYGGAYLEDSNGSFAQIAFGFDNFYQCNYEVWGSKGKVVVHKAFTPNINQEPLVTLSVENEEFNYELDSDNQFVNILHEVLRCINDNDKEDKYEEVLNQAKLIDELRVKAVS